MPDHFDPPDTAEPHASSLRSWISRLSTRAETALQGARRHVRDTRQWAQVQPRQRLVLLVLGAFVALAAAGLLLTALAAGGSALWQWLFSAEPAPPPAPPPQPPPRWLVELQHVGLWERAGSQLLGYANGASATAGTPGWLLLAIWGAAGGGVLLGSWWATRSTACTLAFWAWLAATGWVVHTSTPGGSPVPAAVLVALGVLVSVLPWSAVPVAALVVLGLTT